MVSKNAGAYRVHLERLAELARDPPWLVAARRSALSGFEALGYPTLHDEDWRFTNVSPIAKLPFRPWLEPARVGLPTESLSSVALASLPLNRLVFVDGHYAAELSSPPPERDGLRMGSLASALATDPTAAQRYLLTEERGEAHAFAALNTAFFRDGAFVVVPPGMKVTEPLHLLFLRSGPEAGTAAHVRNVLVAGRGSSLTVLEHYASLGSAAGLTNTVTELVAGDEAQVEHLKVQDDDLLSFHVAHLATRFGRASDVITHSFALGARLSRTQIHAHLAGEGIEAVLNGLYLTAGEQLADHHMVVEHAQPHCASHEYFNGILDDHSRGVFHGRILVHPLAQKTDAKQTNKNLLLSDDALVDTKPQLEIYADDVKCTHGATVGQMDDDSVFYLRSRGIGPDTARRMLMHAFAGEITDRVRCAPLREALDALVWDRLDRHHQIALR